MADEIGLNPVEYDRVDGFAKRLGIPHASKALGVSRQSLYTLLSGRPVKNGTISLVRDALERNVDK